MHTTTLKTISISCILVAGLATESFASEAVKVQGDGGPANSANTNLVQVSMNQVSANFEGQESGRNKNRQLSAGDAASVIDGQEGGRNKERGWIAGDVPSADTILDTGRNKD